MAYCWLELEYKKISEILMEMQIFSSKKMYFKMSSTKWRSFWLGLDVLTWAESPNVRGSAADATDNRSDNQEAKCLLLERLNTWWCQPCILDATRRGLKDSSTVVKQFLITNNQPQCGTGADPEACLVILTVRDSQLILRNQSATTSLVFVRERPVGESHFYLCDTGRQSENQIDRPVPAYW